MPVPFTHRLTAAQRSGEWPADLVEEARLLVEAQHEALTLADRAAALPFDRFLTGGVAQYTLSGLSTLSRYSDLRAMVQALAADGDGAIESIYTSVRLTRATRDPFVRVWSDTAPRLSSLPFVLQHAHPSRSALAKLDGALQELDRDDQLKQQFLGLQAEMIERRAASRWFDTGFEPWDLHRLNQRLDVLGDLIQAAGKPAAERHAAVMSVGVLPLPTVPPDHRRATLESIVTGTERQTAAIRCARRLIAGETVSCRL
jgi:hypothetical protein